MRREGMRGARAAQARLHRRCSLPQISHTQIEHPHPHDNTAHTQHTHVRSSATPPHHGSHTHMVVLSRNSLSPSALLRSPPFKHVNGIQRGREVKSCTSVSRRSGPVSVHTKCVSLSAPPRRDRFELLLMMMMKKMPGRKTGRYSRRIELSKHVGHEAREKQMCRME